MNITSTTAFPSIPKNSIAFHFSSTRKSKTKPKNREEKQRKKYK